MAMGKLEYLEMLSDISVLKSEQALHPDREGRKIAR